MRIRTRITDQRGKDYSRRVQTTHDVVAAVYHRLPSESRSALSVRALSSDVDMPYMLVANEHVLGVIRDDVGGVIEGEDVVGSEKPGGGPGLTRLGVLPGVGYSP